MKGLYHRWGKRALDLSLAALALAFLWPVMALVALLVLLFLGPPVLFRQERPGLEGRPFVLYKFRTMTAGRDARGNLLPDGERLSPFGRFLRSTSLDELPELLNVLRGDMSLVGPRPLLVQYLGLYSPEQARRHAVRPGIAGWAQVHGRNAQSWERRFELDVWYVEHYSLQLDLEILWRTLRVVLRREGISGEGHATMAPFTGASPTLQHRPAESDAPESRERPE